MNRKNQKNSQKPWFTNNVWQQMVSRPNQAQRENLIRPGESENSQLYGLIFPIVAIAICLIVLLVIIIIMCFCKKRRGGDSEDRGTSVVVYPTGRSSAPRFMTKEILFSLPPLRHSSSMGNLLEEDNEGEASGVEPFVPVGRTYTQRSNSFSSYGLGAIDPALYQSSSTDMEEELFFPENHLGRIWFSLRYEKSTEKLVVSLLKAKNLPSRTLGSVSGCDPFVRLHLLPDERRCQQSKTKKKTCNPYFDETFVFQVPSKDLGNHSLKLTVIDSGRTKRRCVLGCTLTLLKDWGIGTEQKLFKMDLEKEEEQESVSSPAGELLISLLYNETLDRLNVTVLEGRGLKLRDAEKPDSYVKVTLNRKYRTVKVKKTATVRGTENPNFFESFNFQLTRDSIDVSSLCFEAYQCVSGYGRDKLIGKFVIGSHMFARGKGNIHWTSACTNPKETHQQWHTLIG